MPSKKAGPNPKLTALINGHLNRYYNSSQPLKIKLWGVMADGLGDFIHLKDVYAFYQKNYSQANIEFQCISMITEEEKLRRIYPDFFTSSVHSIELTTLEEAKQSLIGFINKGYGLLKNYGLFNSPANRNQEKLVDNYIDSKIIIFSADKLMDENKYIDPDTLQSKMQLASEILATQLQNADGIINVSLPLEEITSSVLFLANNKQTYTQSIEEYNFTPEKQPYLGAGTRLFDESHMGIYHNAVGIKIDDKIKELSYKSTEEKSQLLNSLDNKHFQEKLMAGISSEEYLSSHSLAVGYTQDSKQALYYILTAVLSSNKNMIDVCVNLTLINLDELQRMLKKLDISHIEIIDNNQNNKALPLNNGENSKSIKLRLIQFVGISESDKKKLIAVADCVSASGDTSLTELISSKKFPAILDYKRNTINGIQTYLTDNFPDSKELAQYLHVSCLYLQNPKPENVEQLSRVLANNKNEILLQWQQLCDAIINNHNVYDFLPTLVDRVVIASILKKGDANEVKALLELIPTWKINDTNFVYLAILGNNLDGLKIMQENNPSLFNLMIQENHPSIKGAISDFVKFQESELNSWLQEHGMAAADDQAALPH